MSSKRSTALRPRVTLWLHSQHHSWTMSCRLASLIAHVTTRFYLFVSPQTRTGAFFMSGACLCVVVWLRPRAIITVADSSTSDPAPVLEPSRLAFPAARIHMYELQRPSTAPHRCHLHLTSPGSFQNIICLGGLASHPLFSTAGLPPRSQTGGQWRRAQP
ncbi:hypothetical protein GQ607_015592 [Colletotrichum asianum]|uniref:Uncharacterized protein n=1 Tax=Colletotrichum asianum TaxID=702518 RepID=A0A8H3ZII4_9PEZI|nr:hypothetical protein GQ607_015592 [Colletotrichum asianum]